MKEFINTLSKGELHVHLNGLVSTNTIKDLLIKDISLIPFDFNLNTDLYRSKPAKNLAEYLKPWQVLRLIPKSKADLCLIVNSAFENLKKQNICFAELRNSVIYIALLNNISVDEALFWLIDEIEIASEKYMIKAGLILTVSRGDCASDHLQILLKAYDKLGKPPSIVGIDLAGDEDIISPEDVSSWFMKAKHEYGLKITIHAGETGKIQNVIEAIKLFEADRIGHGTAAGMCKDVMNTLREKDICIEVCPISNRLTGAVGEKESHPVVEFVKHNVPFVICSDNPSIHGSSLNNDYMEFYNETENVELLDEMFDRQRKYSFLSGVK
jgi:adenosine deaminase